MSVKVIFMRSFIIILTLGFCIHISYAQISNKRFNNPIPKKIIDSNAIVSWPLRGYTRTISPDGKYFCYTIENVPLRSRTLVVQSTQDSWRYEQIDASPILTVFTKNSQTLIFEQKGDLIFLELGTGHKNKVEKVSNYKQPVGRWFSYQIKDKLILYDLFNGEEKCFPNTLNYWLDKNGTTVLLETVTKNENNICVVLQWMDLKNDDKARIWSVNSLVNKISIKDVELDTERKQLLFMVVQDSSDLKSIKKKEFTTIWYYKVGMLKATRKLDDNSPGISPYMRIAGALRFSNNYCWMLFNLQKVTEYRVANQNSVKVDVWNYKDIFIQPEQLRKSNSKMFAASAEINSSKVIQLVHEYEDFVLASLTNEYIILKGNGYIGPSGILSPIPKSPYYIVSIKDGSRRLIIERNKKPLDIFFSQDGKWVVYYEKTQASYFSYEVSTGKTKNITKKIPTSLENEYKSTDYNQAPVAPVAGWLKENGKLLVYDNYDIWLVDPSGECLPINITNGYGLKNRVKLRLLNGPEGNNSKVTFHLGESVLITAFSSINKYNGFFRMTLGHTGNPELLIMGPYTFYRCESLKPHFYSFSNGMKPLKADSANKWIISRESATEAPNYYLTSDFKSFKKLSDFAFQESYNWLTAELVNWKQLDGTMSQGILYKPKDFNPDRKYPLLFNYYELLSHRLYEYPVPKFVEGDVDIPWFVSRGYLVFTPDISFEVAKKSGKTIGEWAYNSVVSAAQYLSKFKYINAKRMAIQGHSFGGGETNYIIAHSTLFAAACEVAGTVSDQVSAYIGLKRAKGVLPTEYRLNHSESGHDMIGATLWERPDLYIKASPIFNAHRVTTPLLIMHNQGDQATDWGQSAELFMALRRLGKKTWMLQYDDGGHTVSGKEAIDFTIRLTQFFDHYLKGLPPPIWMTKGIHASLKGIENGSKLDPSGNCGTNCNVCKEWNDKYKKHPENTLKEIEVMENIAW